jgi:tRNA dimethylallyltransferase
MLRALEVVLLTGRPLGWWHRNAPPAHAPLPLLVVALDLERAELDRRIDARVHAMIEAGLVDEVRALLAGGVDPDAPGMSATGYREIVEHLSGRLTLADAIAQIQLATRQYARRQLTWFRNQLGPTVLRLDATRPAGDLAAAIVSAWVESGGGQG